MTPIAPLQAARDYKGKELVEVFDKVPDIGKIVISYIGCRGEAGRTALYWSTGLGYAACVQYLMEQWADIQSTDNKHGYTALQLSSIVGRLDIVKWLLGQGADIEPL